MQLTIGISPCPNDTFIFENIALNKIKLPDVQFEFEYHDVQVLNEMASDNALDICKISFAHYKNVKHNYTMLRSGGAMGYGVGPILVKQKDKIIDDSNCTVAIPGINTTAFFLLNYLMPQFNNKKAILFSDIEAQVLNGVFDYGLLIHEGRFTYKTKGLALVADLGELWQAKTQLPIPLGCIVIKNNVPQSIQAQVQQLITNSITNYTSQGLPIISNYIKQYATEMQEHVMMQHIQLYVNEFSKHIPDEAFTAINLLMQ
jgi:1,4-dihydroxy-6-naphthoate synthase